MTCQNCGASGTERHELRAGEGTATCTEPGTALFTCDICGMAEERETPALGHETGDSWQISGQQHWKQCDRCHEELEGTRADHDYQYNAHSGTWICAKCLAVHAWECGDDSLELVSGTTTLRVYRCSHCGLTLEEEGDFSPEEPDLPPPDPEPDPDPEGPEDPDASGGDPPEDGE